MNQAMKWHHDMGDERMRMKTNHKKKNKILIGDGGSCGGDGNGIAGLVLAVAGFIAVVSLSLINKNRTKSSESNPKPKPLKNQEDQEIEINQGLHALLQPSSSTTTIKDATPCHGKTDTESINHVFIQNLNSIGYNARLFGLWLCYLRKKLDKLLQFCPWLFILGFGLVAQIAEKKIDHVANINDISEVVSGTSFQEEIVLSDDSNSESGVSSPDSRIDEDCLASLKVEKVDDDDDVVSEIVEEKDYSSKATLINSKDKQDFNSKDIQNEEHVEANLDTEVGNDVVTDEHEITHDENGNLDMEVNDEDQAMLVSNSFQLTTLLMLLPGLILLLVLLLLMLLTKKFP